MPQTLDEGSQSDENEGEKEDEEEEDNQNNHSSSTRIQPPNTDMMLSKFRKRTKTARNQMTSRYKQQHINTFAIGDLVSLRIPSID